MLTPAQKHFQRVMAERHGKTDEQSDTARTAHEQIMHRLRMDQSALKRVQSDQAKAAMKRQLLPHYEGWIEGTLDGDSGRQDEVIVTLMVWAIDAGDYALAARIGRYVVTHGLLMPDRFNRTAATVLVDEICDPILVQVRPTIPPTSRHIWRCSMRLQSSPPAAICPTWFAPSSVKPAPLRCVTAQPKSRLLRWHCCARR